MSATTIAGHTFKITPHGRRCDGLVYDNSIGGNRTCGVAWLDIKDACQEDVGKLGIAHMGGLSENELKEIQAEKQREQDVIWNAVSGIAGHSR